MIALAVMLFVVLCLMVRYYKEPISGVTGDNSDMDYMYEGSIDSASRSVSPSYGRIHEIFKYESPESWPFDDWNRAYAINVSKLGRVTASPSVDVK
jgi:hypothetical protein